MRIAYCLLLMTTTMDLTAGLCSCYKTSCYPTHNFCLEPVPLVSDAEIKQHIQTLLTLSWFSSEYQNISIDVDHGAVTLKGHLSALDRKTDLEDKIRRINGVWFISSQIYIGCAKPA